MLILRKIMIHLGGELIAALVPQRNALKQARADICLRSELILEIQGRLVHASSWNLIGGEDGGIRRSVSDGCIAPQSSQAAGAIIQDIGVGEGACKCRVSGKIPQPLGVGRNGYRIAGGAPANSVAFVGHKKERLVFFHRAAEGHTKLVL